MGKVGFEPTKPEGNGFTGRPNSPSLALTLVRPVIYSLVTEDFTQLTLMPLFFAIEPSNESIGRTEFKIPAGLVRMLMPMLSSDSFTAFVRLAIRTSADQPVSALPLDPIDGEVALNVAAFARMATPLLPESLIQFIAGPMGFEPTASSVTSWRSNQLELRPQRRDSFSFTRSTS